METFYQILQIIAAVVLSIGGIKGGEFAVQKIKQRRQNTGDGKDEVSSETCALRHHNLDEKLDEMSKDINKINDNLSKIIDLQIEIVRLSSKLDVMKEEIKSEVRTSISDAIEKHENRYHNAA